MTNCNIFFAFDFDGVIVDSTEIKHQAYLSVARSASPDISAELDSALRKDLVGADRNRIARWLSERGNVSEAEVLRSYVSHLENASHSLSPVPGIKSFLQQARTQGIPCSIVSAAPLNEIRDTLNRLRIDQGIFAEIHGNEDGSKAECLTGMRSRLNIAWMRMILFGDMPSDLAAARMAGAKFVRVLSFAGQLCSWPSSDEHPIIENFESAAATDYLFSSVDLPAL